MAGYIDSIASNSMMVLTASTVSTSFMMVWSVSRSTAPWIFRRSRPLLCSTATGTAFGAQQPTGRAAWVGCTASAKITASSADNWFIRAWYALMKLACFAGSSLREIAVGLRCSMPRWCNRAISPDRVWYSIHSIPHSRAIHAPTARVVRGRVSPIQAFSLSCCSTVSRQVPPSWPKLAKPSTPSS